MKINYCYIILHYKAIEETIKSVTSVLEYAGSASFRIIIVDNGSNDDSFRVLYKKFSHKKSIIILKLDENLGFARGNNYGINYAKTKFSPDFYIVMNNDVYLNTENFNLYISEIYKETNFSILGPEIILNDGSSDSNPMRKTLISSQEINKLIIKKYINLFISYVRLDYIKYKIQSFFRKNVETKENNRISLAKNVQLHGSCLIFSKHFINEYIGFNPVTFLFFEEYFLYEIVIKKNLTSIYDQRISVRHDEDSSINLQYDTNYKKNIFVYRTEIDSLKKLKKYKQSLNN